MRISQTAYNILNECKCGPEEFFVLVSSVDFEDKKELDGFIDILVELTTAGLLQCLLENRKLSILSKKDILSYIDNRLKYGENLDEHPIEGDEYSFFTTELGVTYLKNDDKPIEFNKT